MGIQGFMTYCHKPVTHTECEPWIAAGDDDIANIRLQLQPKEGCEVDMHLAWHLVVVVDCQKPCES